MPRAQLKLNPKKCVFGISRGKVIGCLVSMKGIEANPDKINAIVHMKPTRSRKEAQGLTGRIAALNRFMEKIVEQQEAFEALKEYIQKLPTITSPQPDQPLILYVSAMHTTVSGALVQEREILKEDKKILHQVPTYFVSEALAGSKKYYAKMEKICYAVVMSTKNL
jgi:hypothetical protein